MKVFRIIVLGVFILFAAPSFCQETLSPEKVKELILLQQKLEGTWQAQMIETRAKPSFQLVLFEKIEKLRKDEEVVYFKYSDLIRIKILSRNKINEPGFTPMENVVIISRSEVDW